jgi:hypothetical protein
MHLLPFPLQGHTEASKLRGSVLSSFCSTHSLTLKIESVFWNVDELLTGRMTLQSSTANPHWFTFIHPTQINKQTLWLLVHKRTTLSGCSLSAKSVPIYAGRMALCGQRNGSPQPLILSYSSSSQNIKISPLIQLNGCEHPPTWVNSSYQKALNVDVWKSQLFRCQIRGWSLVIDLKYILKSLWISLSKYWTDRTELNADVKQSILQTKVELHKK